MGLGLGLVRGVSTNGIITEQHRTEHSSRPGIQSSNQATYWPRSVAMVMHMICDGDTINIIIETSSLLRDTELDGAAHHLIWQRRDSLNCHYGQVYHHL